MSNIKYTKGDGGDLEPMLDDLSNVGYYPEGTAVNIDDNGLITIITPEDNKEEEVEQHTDELNGDDKTTTSSSASPYAKTREALESQHKSFSQALTDMYNAREESRKKRTRTAKMAALGHAIGDLFGAIGAHYMSGKNNSKAVVPQPLAPKSYEKVQKLIDEGIADKNTFDEYMLSLAQKKGEQNIAMAKAEDNLAIKQAAAALKAAQERGDKDAERALKAYIAQLNAGVKQAEIDAKAAEGEKNRQNAIKVAEIRSDGSDSSKGKKKSNEVLKNWQRRAGEKMVRKTTTTTSTSTNDLTGSIDTRESKAEHSPNETEMRNAYARAEALASKWGIELGEDTIQDFEDLYDLIGKKTTAGNVLTIDGIAALLNSGYKISQIQKAVK